MTKKRVKAALDPVLTRPREQQEELADIDPETEAERRSQAYHATSDELRSLDEAERSGVASYHEVKTAFRAFPRRSS